MLRLIIGIGMPISGCVRMSWYPSEVDTIDGLQGFWVNYNILVLAKSSFLEVSELL